MLYSSLLNGRIKSIQRGLFQFSRNQTGNITVNSVDTNKSLLLLSTANGHSGDGKDRVVSIMVDAYLSSSTNIAWAANNSPSSAASATGLASWQLVEFV